MERRVACTQKELEAAIIKCLGSNGVSAVHIKDLVAVLQKDFTFSNMELCETLNCMSWNGLLNITLHGKEDAGFLFTATHISLNRVVVKKEEEHEEKSAV